jgi:hypothetical protein
MDELTKPMNIFPSEQAHPTLVFLGRIREHYNQEGIMFLSLKLKLTMGSGVFSLTERSENQKFECEFRFYVENRKDLVAIR